MLKSSDCSMLRGTTLKILDKKKQYFFLPEQREYNIYTNAIGDRNIL
jgi:hypothetical protein